jgi:hypothetical protein
MPPKVPRPVWWDRAAAGIDKGQQHCPNTTASQKPQDPAYLRRQRDVEKICRTPRLVAELLDELARHHDIADDIDRRLAAYASIDPALLAAVGGDRFPASPIRAVGDAR